MDKKQFYKSLGAVLKKIRRDMGISQEKVGEMCDVSFQQIQKYESGLNAIPLYKLIQICDYANVRVEAVLKEVVA